MCCTVSVFVTVITKLAIKHSFLIPGYIKIFYSTYGTLKNNQFDFEIIPSKQM